MMRLLTILLCSVCALAVDMPPGIPMPPFGITNTHWMYHPDLGSKTWDYGSGAVAYRTNSYGPYVYYVDNTHGSATDSGNTYGTPTTPRLTWPYPLAAGAVVMVANGGTYSFNSGDTSIKYGGTGTGTDPIFYIGVGATTNISDRPKINREYNYLLGDWTMIEGFTFTNNSKVVILGSMKAGPITNSCVRSNIFFGTGLESTDVVFQNVSTSPYYAENIVVFTNFFSSYGNYTNAVENDACAAIFRDYSTNCWFLYNYVTRMGGDMIRVGSNQDNDLDNCLTDFHYVGRNETLQNGENAVDVKKANRAVISENVFHDFHAYVPSGGDVAISVHYNPNYTWFINNKVYDCIQAVNSGSRMQDTNKVFLVGNLLYDCTDSAVYWRGDSICYLVGNTIHDAVWGYEAYTSGAGAYWRYTNNIVMDCSTFAILNANSTTRANAQIGYDCYYKAGGGNLFSWGSTYTSVAAWLAAASTGDNSVEGDPLFVNAAGGDFRIQSGGAATGTGDPNAWTFIEAEFLEQFGFALNYKDLSGNARVNDIGAYEYSSTQQRGRMNGVGRIGKGNL